MSGGCARGGPGGSLGEERLLVMLLVTGVFGRLWLRSRRSYPAQEAQLTLSNIHHITEVAS